MSDTPLPDALDQFLQAPPHLPRPAELQESVFKRTTQTLHKPQRRRWHLVVGAAASIVLATATAYIAYRWHSSEPAPQKDLVERKQEIGPEQTLPLPEEPKPTVAVASKDPLKVEWSAFDTADDQQRARLYFQAGDLYLESHKDFDSALRCYHQALHYGDARAREFNPDDNYLVMALKRDYRKEN